GGFPGVVLKILEPTIRLTLLDGLGKRVTFLEELCQTLGLEGTSCVHARAEELAHDPRYREQFDVATSRAVAALPILCELCLPYVKPGGDFLAMKSTREEKTFENPSLGDGIAKKAEYQIPETDIWHRVIRIPKIKNTAKEYPRRWSKIKKVKI
ncbi:MAG: RsmG family class I SAM-dependent methyltransferase, partial [Evtepia sp.]